jgi:hypothetical protein
MSNGHKPTGTPKRVEVTMYDVGFGDCFLLSFVYAGNKTKRVLIDCGMKNQNDQQVRGVVSQLVEDAHKHVDAMVITHRHSDHLSAFGDPVAGPQLSSLSPDLVLQPWTEEPLLDDKATSPDGEHVKLLAAAQGFAEALAKNVPIVVPGATPEQQQLIEYIAGLSLKNPDAVARLAVLGKERRYLSFGGDSGLGKLLPGVTVSVLGPPTLEQCPAIKTESQSNPSEFWRLQQSIAATLGGGAVTAGGDDLFPGAATVPLDQASPEVRWALGHLDGISTQNVERFVRRLDDAMNNTSLILLFEVGDKVLLFPGDAQWENWQYALGQDGVKERLANVDLYKVGHHGSCNATPMSLWKLFQRRNADSDAQRMTSLLPTAVGPVKHVPRSSLVKALKKETNMTRSDKLGKDVLSYPTVLTIGS